MEGLLILHYLKLYNAMLGKNSIRVFLLFVASPFLIFGCSKTPKTDLTSIHVPNKIDEPVLLSELAITDKKIKLETKDGVFLGNIVDVKLYKDRLFVSDKKKVSIFDLEGNFIQFLGEEGEGPGEYKLVTSMDIDSASGLIYVSSYNKLLVFGADLGLVEERKLGYPIGYLKVLDGDLWIVSEEIGIKVGDKTANQTNLYKLGNTFEISDTIPFRRVILDKIQIGGYWFRYWLSDTGEGIFLFMPVLTPENTLRDTLYQLSDGMIKPAIKFHFERAQSLNEQGYQTLLLYNVVNSSSYYILEYAQDWEPFMFLYDKKNKIGYNLSKGLTDADGDPVFLRPLDLDADLFYYTKKKAFSDLSTEEENPEIGIVKLR